MMTSKASPATIQKPSRPQKPATSSISATLTPSEQQSLQQNKRDLNAYFQKAFKKK